MDNLRLRSRELRKNQTPPENILWFHLRNKQIKGAKFRRQAPIGQYIVDFVCFEKKLIVEADGSQHNDKKQKQHDVIRRLWFESQGFTTLRFWNNDISNKLESVLEKISLSLDFT